MESQKMEFLAIGDYLVNVNGIGSIYIGCSLEREWFINIDSRVASHNGTYDNTLIAHICYESEQECRAAMGKVIAALSGHIIHKI